MTDSSPKISLGCHAKGFIWFSCCTTSRLSPLVPPQAQPPVTAPCQVRARAPRPLLTLYQPRALAIAPRSDGSEISVCCC